MPIPEADSHHLTAADQMALLDMADRVDLEEILLTVGTMIGRDHPDPFRGHELAAAIGLVATGLAADPAWRGRRKGRVVAINCERVENRERRP